MDIATDVAGKVITCGIALLEREISYLIHFRRNIKNLRTKTGDLTATINEVQQLVNAARSKIEVLRETVTDWLQEATTVRNEAVQLNTNAGNINRWCKGRRTGTRISLSRKAEKVIADIQDLLNERREFGDSVSHPKLVQDLEFVATADFDSFASRETITNRIMHALEDDKIGSVGVFGMPGVGKTMLIQALCKHVKKKRMFDEVVMVVVSQNLDLKTIQADVAMELGLELGGKETIILKARRLSERLMQREKTLIVLDDLWDRVELAQVGVPYKIDNKRSKVVFTTRSRDVCNMMESDVNFEVKVLPQEESWELFQNRAWDVENSSALPTVAKDIANECKGLPLAIVAVARALRGKDEYLWDNALQQLKESVFSKVTPVFSSIKMSYNYMQSEEHKMCFLFCSLFPEDFKIDMEELFCYLTGEKLLGDGDTILIARRKFYVIVDELVSSCLLLRDEQFIKMHDLVRDAAISIAHEDGKEFIVKAAMGMRDWPNIDLGRCRRLSLIANKLRRGPSYQIQAPHLLTFSLSGNKGFSEFPDDFFKEMKNLLNLDLSHTRIASLPQSFFFLENLRTLRLENCGRLKDISPVEKLKSLQTLSLQDCDDVNLSNEIGKLTNLKMLNLNICKPVSSKVILSNVISSLFQLEELHFTGWEVMPGSTPLQSDTNLTEVMCLSRLTSLHIQLTIHSLSQDAPSYWEKLSEFAISISRMRQDIWNRIYFEFLEAKRHYDRCMFLEIPSVSLLAKWVVTLVERTNCLFLYHCGDVESVEQVYQSRMSNNLKLLDVQYGKFKFLTSGSVDKAFSNLEELRLNGLSKFEAICDGEVPLQFLHKLRVLNVGFCGNVITLLPCDLTVRLQNLEKITVIWCLYLENLFGASIWLSSPIFPHLRHVEIKRCERMKYIFPLGVVRHLLHLEVLDVEYSFNIDTIITHEDDADADVDADKDKAILPQLKELTLRDLPELSSLCRSGLLVDWPSLVSLQICECGNLKRLPFNTHSVPKLKEFVMDRDLFNRLDWEDESIMSRLDRLRQQD